MNVAFSFLLLTAAIAVVVALQQWLRLRAILREEEAARDLRGRRSTEIPEGHLGPQELLEPPRALREALRAGECVLFLGSEQPFALGRLVQGSILRSLLIAHQREFQEDMAEALDARLRRDRPELVAQLLSTLVSPAEIEPVLRDMEDAERLSPGGRRALRALVDLPFSGVLTDAWGSVETMFDDRDPTVLASSEDVGPSFSSLLRAGSFFLVHLKGTVRNPASLRLSWQQFKEDIHDNQELFRFLSTLHASRTLLFVGAGLETIEEYLDAISPLPVTRPHFALVAGDIEDFQLKERAMLEQFNVQLIPAARQAQARFIETLQMQTGGSAGPSRRLPKIKPPRAQRLRLQNIGPFGSLELPLDKAATVLLGDNGSGKSSVLRAIALGLSGEGESVDEAAEGLLRVGSGRGSIELELEGGSVRAVLERNRGRPGVSVRADQSSPVVEGLWLSIGFPPLRGASTGPLRGPVPEGDRDPSVDDLLPLAGNAIDQRFGDLQQWILNAAVVAEGKSDQARQSWRMLGAFFDVVAQLTPGVKFEFVGYDPDSWEVLLKTEDGVLSMDQLSRGMTAVLGWVGLLLRRLFQVYGDHPQPQEERALVLVDEIDLHLHPAWQREVLPLLMRHFPNVQLIASTHSPLVVGSMTQGCMVQLQREGGTIEPEVFPDGFTGWRSDQILTGPAFDLKTTRDPLTEERLAEYRRLLARDRLNPGERERVERLAHQLREEIPSSQETESGREGANLVREAIRDRLQEIAPERREEVQREADLYLRSLQKGKGDG